MAIFCPSYALAGAAACSPGIPCTTYDLTSVPDAGVNPSYNGPKTGQASPYTSGACDGNFMNQITSRAFMQASRETVMSAQIITKPDSVLEYTCFDQYIAKTAHQAGPIFSETDQFANRGFALRSGTGGPGDSGNDEGDGSIDSASPPACSASPCDTYTTQMPNTQLDNRLRELLLDTLNAYITNNFNHTFLGGEISIDNNMNLTSIGGDSYNCSHMNTVWNVAQCVDFGEHDRFRSFEILSTRDPRALPAVCTGATATDDSSNPLDDSSSSRKIPDQFIRFLFGSATIPSLFEYDDGLVDPCPAVSGSTSTTTGITTDQIRLSNNCDYSYVTFDPMRTYFNIMKSPVDPTGSLTDAAVMGLRGHPLTCSPPLPTGMLAVTYKHEYGPGLFPYANIINPDRIRYVYMDHVCPNPGCYYRPTSMVPWPEAYNPVTGAPLVANPPLNLLPSDTTGVTNIGSARGVCLSWL